MNKLNILDNSKSKVDVIYHISDVHIKAIISDDLKIIYI